MTGSSRRWLLCWVALLLVAVAVFVWPRFASPVSVGPAADPPSGDAAAAVAKEAVEGVERDPAAELRMAADVDAASEPLLRVRVVLASTGSPVAAAAVFHIPEMFSVDGERPDVAAALALPPPLRTDAAGFAALPLHRGKPELVFCSHEGMWAEAVAWQVPEDGAPLLLQLQEDFDLRVQVLGPAGEPVVGAPVIVASPDRMNGRELLLGGSLEQATAAPDGIAVFAHLRPRIDSTVVLAMLDMPLPERVLANVDLAASPPQPVILRLPATGALTLRLVDAQGPWAPPEVVSVGIEDRTTDGGEPERHTYLLRDGRLTLSHVGLARRLFAKVECDWCRGELLIEGPTTAGEHRVVDLRVVRQPLLTGRLVTETRAPVAGEGWLAVYAAGDWTSYNVWFETDAAGRFSMPLPPVFVAGSEMFTVLVPAGQPRPGNPMARVQLPEWLLQQPKDLELGDVVVGPAPVLVDGVVVDLSGAAVPGVALRVQEHRGGVRETAVDTSTVSDADGRFAIRAFLPATGLHLVAEKSMHRTQDLPLRVGERGLRVVMPATGRVVAKVRLDEGVPMRLLLASCTESAAGRTQTRGCHLAIEGDELTFDDVTPGAVTVALRPVGESEPVWLAANVTVRGGETTTLPEIDLRGKLRAVRVRVVDDARRPVLDANVRIDPDRDGAREHAVTHDGSLTLLLHRPVSVLVHADGHANVLLPELFADAEATLPAGLAVELQLQQAPPAPPLRLEAVLDLLGIGAAPRLEGDLQWRDSSDLYEFGDARSLSTVSGVAGDDGRVRLSLPHAGTWRLRWLLRKGEVRCDVDVAPVELSLGTTSGPVAVSLPPAVLVAAIARLQD